jgi:transposase
MRPATNGAICTRRWKSTGRTPGELLFTPAIDQDIHALFLQQIADSDPQALHVIIADQAGFHLRPDDARLPPNLRLLPLPPYCPELNPVERFGGLLKAAAARRWSTPAAVSSLIHTWLAEQTNAGAKT